MSTFEISCKVVHTTPGAVLIEDGQCDKHGEPIHTWLPLSAVETEDELEVGAFVELSVPERMAIDKGLC